MNPSRSRCRTWTSILIIVLVACIWLPAQQGAPGFQGETPTNSSIESLQKATENPVSDLISFPLQNNTNVDIGPYNRTQNVLNIQPIIPIHLTSKWNLITRTILPIIWQPYPAGTGGQYGTGDLNPTFFISPAGSTKMIWGAGPAIVVPTGSKQILGQGKLSVGPSFAALAQPSHWTLGAVVNNMWSIAGSGGRPNVNQMWLQYFISYNMRKGWYFTTQPIITANWKATSGNVWTVPVGGGMGRIMKLGLQPVNISAQFFGNAAHPSGASPWGMRFQIAFLFPKLTPKQKMLLMEQSLKELEKQQGMQVPRN
jgi:hypothetical protein